MATICDGWFTAERGRWVHYGTQNKGRNTSSCPLVLAVFGSCQLILQLLQLSIIHMQSKPRLFCNWLPLPAIHQVLSSCSICPLTLQLLQLDVWCPVTAFAAVPGLTVTIIGIPVTSGTAATTFSKICYLTNISHIIMIMQRTPLIQGIPWDPESITQIPTDLQIF